jgi:hypothetical protein
VSAEGAVFLADWACRLRELLQQPVTGKPARYCRGCLDCTERRPHLAGLVGEAMLDSFVKNDWLRRVEGRRELRLTPRGARRCGSGSAWHLSGRPVSSPATWQGAMVRFQVLGSCNGEQDTMDRNTPPECRR